MQDDEPIIGSEYPDQEAYHEAMGVTTSVEVEGHDFHHVYFGVRDVTREGSLVKLTGTDENGRRGSVIYFIESVVRIMIPEQGVMN